MVQAPQFPSPLAQPDPEAIRDLNFQLPDPEDERIQDSDFQQQIETAWQVCDRFDLQTDIWRGRILRVIRDREKRSGDGRGSGFLNWLKDREISKSQAYALIELANSADTLLDSGHLDPASVECFSKRAFVETAQAAPPVQQMVSDAARRGERITRREVRQLADEWTAMSSDLLPEVVKEKAATNVIPSRYLAPLVRELEKLPPTHQTTLQTEVATHPDLDTLKQTTAEARSLVRYLAAAAQVQALESADLDLESALEEALRLGSLNLTADLVNHAAQLEQAIAKLYTHWKRVSSLSDKLYLESGASTPHLRSLLRGLQQLAGEIVEIQLADPRHPHGFRSIRLQILPEDS